MTERDIEPDIAEAVQSVANRYGVRGLEDLIDLAQEEVVVARRALAELEELASDPGPAPGADAVPGVE